MKSMRKYSYNFGIFLGIYINYRITNKELILLAQAITIRLQVKNMKRYTLIAVTIST